jgi:hypothetical protein
MAIAETNVISSGQSTRSNTTQINPITQIQKEGTLRSVWRDEVTLIQEDNSYISKRCMLA